MAKPELGAKRQCQSCGVKFFDLNKDPIVCPKCGTVFQGAGARAERATVKEEEADEETPAPAGVELVSLDEVEATEEKTAEPAVDDIDVEDDGRRGGRVPRRGGRGRRRRQLADRRRNRARRRALTAGKKIRAAALVAATPEGYRAAPPNTAEPPVPTGGKL